MALRGKASKRAPASVAGRLRTRLAKQFKLVETRLTLPRSRVTYRICQPDAVDPLLDAAADDPEQNLPYWAVTWPSGIALADVVLAERARFSGQRVLELGCGLGITATAALVAGARLAVTDYAPEALLLCRLNTLSNTGHEPYTLQLNWRQPRPALFKLARPPFPDVLAADVLYETRDVNPLLDLVERLVARGGTLWLAEPRRAAAQQFLAAATVRGWRDEVQQHTGPWSASEDTGAIVNIHRLQRS